jgi:hypothetical protein
MVSTSPTCDLCKRRNVIEYRVEPEEAWKVVVLNRWRNLCPSCFDIEAEKAGVRYTFTNVVKCRRRPIQCACCESAATL